MSSNAERLWYSPVIEAVFLKGLGERLTPGLRAELKKLGRRLAHAKNLRVVSADSAPPGHTFRVEWDD